MTDPRLKKLARVLVDYSCRVKPGERVLIQNYEPEIAFVREIVDAVYDAGGLPFVTLKSRSVDRTWISRATPEQLSLQARFERDRMKEMDCYIGFTSFRNSSAWSDIPMDRLALYNSLVTKPVHKEERQLNTRWVVLRYPSDAMAQLASMSTEAFEDFYFEVCTLDYERMSRAMDSLVALMRTTDAVRIVARGTDLSFSIKGLSPVKCDGRLNIPDGEVYTAPVRDSVNGTIAYNTPSEHDGFTYENVAFEFRDGRIIKASANDSIRINQVLDTDGGARHIGEFAIGLNPFITRPMKETLFDEKIAGSIHLTPGNSYEDCFNGNVSAVHWDLVLLQTPEYGGGEIWFDGKLVRKDGLFVVPELLCLNPDELKKN